MEYTSYGNENSMEIFMENKNDQIFWNRSTTITQWCKYSIRFTTSGHPSNHVQTGQHMK